MPFTPSKSFFGPEQLGEELFKTRDRPSKEVDGLRLEQAPLSPENRLARENSATNSHPSADPAALAPGKKSRKSGTAERPEGLTNGGSGGEGGTEDGGVVAMEIESNGISHECSSAPVKSPSPSEMVDADGDVGMGMGMSMNMSMGEPSDAQDQEPVPVSPPTFTLTNGCSVGVQSVPAKAADLNPNTTVFDVAGGHVIHALWRPNDPSVVAVAGLSYCGLWKLSTPIFSLWSSLSSSPPPPSSRPTYERLVERSDGTWVSTVAWDPTGQKLAVATYNKLSGSITMYDIHGDAVDLLPDVPRMITGLHWADHGSRMVIVASEGTLSELAVWDDSIRLEERPPPEVIEGRVYDLSWAGDNEVYACGDGAVFRCEVDSRIHRLETFAAGGLDTQWTYIKCAKIAGSPVVAAASSAKASIWIPTHDLHLDGAHQSPITAIALHPQSQHCAAEIQPDAALVLASSAMDDVVKIWRPDLASKRFICLHRLFLGHSVPALASAFSPDGYAIAAASTDKLFIWSVERGGVPLATWSVPGRENADEYVDQAVNGENGYMDESPMRCLSWDSDGKRLALGFEKQVRSFSSFPLYFLLL